MYDVTDEQCNARAALDQWREDNPEAPSSTLLGVRLRKPETKQSEAEQAAAEIADMKRRHGLI